MGDLAVTQETKERVTEGPTRSDLRLAFRPVARDRTKGKDTRMTRPSKPRPTKPSIGDLITQLNEASKAAFNAVVNVQARMSEITLSHQVLALDRISSDLMETRRRCAMVAMQAGDAMRGLPTRRVGNIVINPHKAGRREGDTR